MMAVELYECSQSEVSRRSQDIDGRRDISLDTESKTY